MAKCFGFICNTRKTEKLLKIQFKIFCPSCLNCNYCGLSFTLAKISLTKAECAIYLIPTLREALDQVGPYTLKQ